MPIILEHAMSAISQIICEYLMAGDVLCQTIERQMALWQICFIACFIISNGRTINHVCCSNRKVIAGQYALINGDTL